MHVGAGTPLRGWPPPSTTARTRRPDVLERPLRLACRRTGGQDVVADHERDRAPRPGPAGRADGGRTPIEPARLAARSPGVEPGLVGDRRRAARAAGAPATSAPLAPQQPRRGPGDPQHRVVPAGAHDARPRRHRHEHGRCGRRRARARSGRREQRARAARPGRRRRAPCGRAPWRAAARRTPPPRSRPPARPGTASAAPRARRWAASPRSRGTATGPGGAQPTQPPPWTRSSQASSTVAACAARERRRCEARARLWTADARARLWTRAVSGRRPPRPPWSRCAASCRCR